MSIILHWRSVSQYFAIDAVAVSRPEASGPLVAALIEALARREERRLKADAPAPKPEIEG